MSLLVFLNGIDNNNKEAILESYTCFGIDQDVTLESATETIKNKTHYMIEKIKEWINSFIRWIKKVFRKKVDEIVKKQISEHTQHRDEKDDSGVTKTRTAFVNKHIFVTFINESKKLLNLTKTITRDAPILGKHKDIQIAHDIDRNRGFVFDKYDQENDEDKVINEINDITSKLNALHSTNENELIELNMRLLENIYYEIEESLNGINELTAKMERSPQDIETNRNNLHKIHTMMAAFMASKNISSYILNTIF